MGEYGPLAFRSEGNLDALETYLKWASKQPFWATRFIPRTGDVEEFERFSALAFRHENYLLVVEEAAAVTQAGYLPPNFGRIVRPGPSSRDRLTVVLPEAERSFQNTDGAHRLVGRIQHRGTRRQAGAGSEMRPGLHRTRCQSSAFRVARV
jgi:hypothetical protein